MTVNNFQWGLTSARIAKMNHDGSIDYSPLPAPNAVGYQYSNDTSKFPLIEFSFVPDLAFKTTWSWNTLTASQYSWFRDVFRVRTKKRRTNTLHRQRLAHKRWLMKRGIVWQLK